MKNIKPNDMKELIESRIKIQERMIESYRDKMQTDNPIFMPSYERLVFTSEQIIKELKSILDENENY